MKKTAMITLGALALAGCTTTTIETPEWKVSSMSHWLKRDVDKLAVERNADGSYRVNVNGYKTDASEQLPAFTRETLGGLAVFGRLAAAIVNPTVGAVPLTADGADADALAKIQKAVAEYKANEAKAKAEAAKAKAELKAAQAELEKAKAEAAQPEPMPECEGDECEYITE